ncbi:MAG: hypothetical protein DME06_03970 [Candidatus Rokuibacteriota bacterium]|nr:MAG: hypothetical protein DME06_03970 [Candidatus Rokubacteria bacterium]
MIVTRNKPGLYEYVKRLVARYPRIQVMLDRRRVERRERVGPIGVDRRRAERRSQPEVTDELRARGWAMTRRGAGGSETPAKPEG